MKDPKFVCVCWRDHNGDAGWLSEKDFHKRKPVLAETYGWLVDQNDERWLVCNSRLPDEEGEWGGDSVILTSCIEWWQEIEFLEEQKL